MNHRVRSPFARTTATLSLLALLALASVASCSSGRSSRGQDAVSDGQDGTAGGEDVTAVDDVASAVDEDTSATGDVVSAEDASTETSNDSCDGCADVIDTDPPLTTCTYGFELLNPEGKTLGQGCSVDSDCQFGVCMEPGDLGNAPGEDAINSKFGFCTRGCDCNEDTDSRLTDEEKVDFLCYVGPPGSQGKLKYVLPRCQTVADCLDVDPGYDTCALPGGSGVFKACVAP